MISNIKIFVDTISYLFLYISALGLSEMFVKHLLEDDDKYKMFYYGILLSTSLTWFFFSNVTIY